MKLPSLDGGSWVDLFGLVFILRLLAVLGHFPPLTYPEAGIWAATISAFAYSNPNKPS
jgi:hypothetical protein